ncbi:MAG TPA: hypothetical protein VM915_04265 [Verrucomicrobiae bacterium]|nr:hypothetical protein [Verrucomicrobiae bacterium]
MNADHLYGRHEGGVRQSKASFSHRLQAQLGKSGKIARLRARVGSPQAYDRRQLAHVSITYVNHAGNPGGVKKYLSYVARDGISRDGIEAEHDEPEREREDEASPACDQFYSDKDDGLDAFEETKDWADKDPRHFRLILSAENGAQMSDLKDFTRDVMARTEAALHTRLDWVAIDHWDSERAHTHVVVRGRTDDGRPLYIPRAYCRAGFRQAARDAATERLGRRPEDPHPWRGEALAHRPSWLDKAIQDQASPEGRVRLSALQAPDHSPETSMALRARVVELKRMGLAIDEKARGMRLLPDWRERLKAMERHLAARREIMRAPQFRLTQSMAQGRGADLDR